VGFHARAGDLQEPVAAEQVAAEVIKDGQWIAVDPVAHAELALEVDGPDLVGRGRVERGGPRMLPVPAAAAMLDAVVAREDVEDGTPGGPGPLRVAGPKALQDLAGAPAKPGVFLEDALDDVGRGLVRAGARSAAVLVQPPRPALTVAVEPLVAGVPADAVAQAQLGHRPLATGEVLGKMVSFEHGIGLLPGHPFSSYGGQEKCHPCARTAVTYVPRLYPRGT
jgi:hypothetical protein